MSVDSIPLRRIDHVRFFVGNARQSAYFYRNAFGFDVVAYEGLETGVKHEAGYVLRQGHITFVLTSPLRANDPDNMRLMFHGDGVQDIALEVDDVSTPSTTPPGAAPSVWCRRRGWRTSTAPTNTPPSAPTATRRTASSTATATRASSPPAIKPIDPERYSPTHLPPRRPEGDRPHRRQRRGREDGRVGRACTSTSWASRSWSTSTTRTSAPSTPH